MKGIMIYIEIGTCPYVLSATDEESDAESIVIVHFFSFFFVCGVKKKKTK